MSTEELKMLAARFVEEVIHAGHFDRAEEFFTADYIDHALPPGVPQGLEGLRSFFSQLRTAFPDLHYTLEDTIAEGDKVVQRFTTHGTMRGPLLGMPATGKSATWSEIHIVRAAGGKFVEHWAIVDQLDMFQQLGLAPARAVGGR